MGWLDFLYYQKLSLNLIEATPACSRKHQNEGIHITVVVLGDGINEALAACELPQLDVELGGTVGVFENIEVSADGLVEYWVELLADCAVGEGGFTGVAVAEDCYL